MLNLEKIEQLAEIVAMNLITIDRNTEKIISDVVVTDNSDQKSVALKNKIDKLGQPSSQQFVPAQQPNNEHSLTDIVAVGEMLLPIKAQLDDINSKLEHLPHAASNDNATRLLIEANTKIESVDSKLKEITLTTASQSASKPLNTEGTTISSDALKEFEERLNLISKDVMVMRNSTHSILKNMETQLIDRSSKEGRMSLIIAIGALVVAIAILLKLYGAI